MLRNVLYSIYRQMYRIISVYHIAIAISFIHTIYYTTTTTTSIKLALFDQYIYRIIFSNPLIIKVNLLQSIYKTSSTIIITSQPVGTSISLGVSTFT